MQWDKRSVSQAWRQHRWKIDDVRCNRIGECDVRFVGLIVVNKIFCGDGRK